MQRLFAIAALLLLSACVTVEIPECCPDTAEPTRLRGDQLRVVNLNMAHGRGTSINQMLVSKQSFLNNLDAIAEQLTATQPDVVALQEVDAASRWSGLFNHLDYLRTKTGWREYIHGEHQQGYLANFGTALVSPHDLQGEYSQRFKSTWPTTTKGFVTATISWEGANKTTNLTVYSVHLDFSRRKVRQAQIDQLMDYIGKTIGPIIIAGDFNGELANKDSAVRELIDELGLKAYQPDAEGLGTYKKSTGKRLDWILISQELEFIDYRVIEDKVSDHLTVVADIAYRP
ncbi:MAG: endonuclease/exonuclease/phosphatase family protein [Gammaproteobacteria bacterium]